MTSVGLHGPRAVSRRARARPHQPEPDGRRGRGVGRRRRRRAGLSRARRRAARRGARAGDGRARARAARRCTARSSRAATSGRTGPCVGRIVDAGIRRVVAAVEDPNPAVRGRGFAYLRRARRRRRSRARQPRPRSRLNQPFFTLMREGRPFVILKAATSLDGCLAAAPGQRDAADVAAGQPARARVPRRSRRDRRRRRDGAGRRSAADRARGLSRAAAGPRVISIASLRTPPTARVLSTRDAGPVIIVTTAAARRDSTTPRRLEERGARDRGRPRTARLARRSSRWLRGRSGRCCSKAAPRCSEAAWDEGLVDYVRLYVTPQVLGPGGVPVSRRPAVLHRRRCSSGGSRRWDRTC